LPSSDLSQWKKLISKIEHLNRKITVGLVGKYINSHDAYLSIEEALKHASYFYDVKIEIKWIDSEYLTDENISENLSDCDGILVPGGFGFRAVEGKIKAVKYAREKDIPFFGICFGMQIAIIEYARNVLKLEQANSLEADLTTPYPVIIKKKHNIQLGGSLRLGLYLLELKKDSRSYHIYEKNFIKERHRHRYEMNLEYLSLFDKDPYFNISGFNHEEKIPEIIELKNHFWFIGVQFHPEFLSRPLKPHPLFKDFINFVIKYNTQKNTK
jgi:CTP synthase